MRQCSTQKITYSGLLDLLPSLPHQHPQCEGDNKHCLLFTTVPQHDGRFFKVKKLNQDAVEVDAGRVQGVTKGTEFALYQDSSLDSPSFGVYYTTSVRITSSKLTPMVSKPLNNIPDVSYAIITRWGCPDAQLAVFADPRTLSAATVSAIGRIWQSASAVSITSTTVESDADVSVQDVHGQAGLVRINSLVGSHFGSFQKPQFHVPRDRIADILRAIAHFKFHLIRTNTSDHLHGHVAIELYQLEETDDGSYVPTGDNLVLDGHARIILSDSLYGMTLRNNSRYNLFPSLFYFNPSDLSIEPCYIPPSSTMSAPLRQHSVLTVGHGNNDGNALKFYLNAGERSDTGFLVLLLSTKYADTTHIQQCSPLDGVVARHATMCNVDQAVWSRAYATVTVAREKKDFLSLSCAMSSIPRAFHVSSSARPWLSSLRDKVHNHWQ